MQDKITKHIRTKKTKAGTEILEKMRFAYQAPTYEEATSLLKELIQELERINDSAARSLMEGRRKR